MFIPVVVQHLDPDVLAEHVAAGHGKLFHRFAFPGAVEEAEGEPVLGGGGRVLVRHPDVQSPRAPGIQLMVLQFEPDATQSIVF